MTMNDVCKECEETFDDAEQVRRHLRKHEMTFQQYSLKWFHHGVLPVCKCGCGQQTSWNVALKGYAEFVRGHHAWGRKKSDDEKQKIGRKNSENMKRFYLQHPDKALAQAKLMQQFITPEIEARRIKTLRKTYNEIDKTEFRDRTKKRWDSGEMTELRQKAASTFKQRSANGEYDFTERNQKLSEAISKKYVDGTWNFTKGSYTSIKTGRVSYYRSAWELEFMQRLDADSDVSDWESEFTSIPYSYKGATHRYVPDFHVVRGVKHQLVEVKPQALRMIERNVIKRSVAQQYCDEKGWEYIEWEPV